MSNLSKECCGDKKTRIIYTCSGASNLGEISDKVGRKIRGEGLGKASCLSALGADVSSYIQTAKDADECVVIDGCQVNCGKNIFKNLGLNGIFFTLTDFGLEKGKTVVSDEVINNIAENIKKEL